MIAATRPVLVLGRHGGTEVDGSGASPGTLYLFASLEQHLRDHFDIIRVPPYFYAVDSRTALRIAIDLVSRADACLLGLPPEPVDLDPLLLARARLAPQMPVAYMPLGEFPRGARFYRHIYRRLTARDAILFSSSSDLRVYERLVSASPARTAVVSFGIEPERFQTGERDRVRSHLGLGPEHVVFVYHGRVAAEKNVTDVLSMFGEIAPAHPHARLWIIGPIDGIAQPRPGPNPVSYLADGSLSTAFKLLVARTGTEHQVSFWGPLASDAIPSILSAADIAVSLTVNGDENFGYGVVEAMAAGLPVIGTDWGGLEDTIADGSTGLVVDTITTPFGVNVDMWQAVGHARRLVGDAGLRRTLGDQAMRRVHETFTVTRFAAGIAEQIMTLLCAEDQTAVDVHQWSPLGTRIVEQYSRASSDRPDVQLPVSVRPTPTMLREHPLMQLVLAPYGTRRTHERTCDDDMLFLCSGLITLRDAELLCSDPRRPPSSGPVSIVEAELVRVLAKQRFLRAAELIERASEQCEPERARAALRALLQAGIINQSRAPGQPERSAST